jgi:rod shape-determining protein MreC
MMHPIQHSKKGLFGINFFRVYATLFIVVVLVLIFGVMSPMRSLVQNLFSPLFQTGNFFHDTLGQIPKFFSDKNQLIKENSDLLNEMEKNRLNAVDYETMKYENQKLREMLGVKPSGNFKAAFIIAKPPQIPMDSLFLDKGAKFEIHVGDLVLSSDKTLIGKIAEVSNNRSIVALTSFAGSVSYGYVARTNEPIEMTGGGGGNIEAKVPIDFDIVAGDKIMTGGQSGSLAAVASAIKEDRSSGFKNVLMSLPADVSKINIVFLYSLTSE